MCAAIGRKILAGWVLALWIIGAVPVGVHAQTSPGNLADCVALIDQIRAEADATTPLHERYRDLRVIDVHNHEADRAESALADWDRWYIDQTVLFGAISEPRALYTDVLAFAAYRRYPERVYPFFAGVPVYDEVVLDLVTQRLEEGFYGIGEIVGASTHSPTASQMPWKAEHPHDGYLPAIYDLTAAYRVPVLLHIDPPNGLPIIKLEEALDAHPDAILIFAHANAFNPPGNIEPLLERHPNLYIDFFAGFTAYNPGSANTLADFVPLIEAYPNRFFVSTDSGYDIGYDNAARAMYELIDLLSPETACRVAYWNWAALMDAQPATQTQIARIEELTGEPAPENLSKSAAHEMIFALEAE